MGNIRFTSQLTSLDGRKYKVDFFQSDYIGIETTVIGGTGNTFYLQGDWTDYINIGQAIEIDGVDGTTSAFATYNAAQDRTEVLTSLTYSTDGVTFANDPDRAGSYIPSFTPKIVDLHTEWTGQGDEILDSIKSSYTDIIYADRSEDKSVDVNDNAWFHRFIDAWNTGNDLDAKLVIYKDVSSTWELHWVGRVVPDLLEWDNANSPRDYTFRVNDGIDTLKDVRYDGDLDNLGMVKCIDLIKECLGSLDLDQFWGASDPYIYEGIEFKSKQLFYQPVSANYSPLDYTGIPENLLIEREERETREFISYYDILKAILDLFSARISHSDGAYWINQVRNFDTPSGYTVRVFDKTNSTYTTTTQSFRKTMQVLSGGKFGHFAGLKDARVVQDYNRDVQINIASGYLGSVQRVGGSVTAPSIDTLIGKVYSGNGSENIMRVEMQIVQKQVIPNNVSFYLDVEVEILDDFNSLKFIQGSDTITPYWGNDSVTVNRYWTKRVYSKAANWATTLVFDTPFIPYDLDQARLKINFRFGAVSSFSTPDRKFFDIYKVKVNFPTESQDSNFINEIKVTNPDTNFTKTLQLDDLMIKESNAVSSINTLNVLFAYNGSGYTSVDYVPAELWDGDYIAAPLGDPLAWLRVMEAMSLQYRPIQKYTGSWEGELFTYECIDYDGTVWAMNGYRHDYLTDEYSGEWFEADTGRGTISAFDNGGGSDESDRGGGDFNIGLSVRNEVDNNTLLRYLDAPLTAGTITAITVVGVSDIRLREGDTISLINPLTMAEYESFVLDSDLSSGGTNISVTSKTLNNDIPAGAIVKYKKGEVVESNILRSDFVDTKYPATIPYREGRVAYDDTSNELIVGANGKNLNIAINQNRGDAKTDISGVGNNDYALSGRNMLLFNCTDAVVSINGFAPDSYVDGEVIRIANVSSNQLTLNFENTGSSAANRIAGSGAKQINEGQYVELMYSTDMDRWLVQV